MNINKKDIIFGVRGDLHGRVALTQKHISKLIFGKFDGIIDVGDIEATHIGIKHPLREGQDLKKESTIDAIIRNGLDDKRNLTGVGNNFIDEALRSIKEMSTHNRLYDNYFFRCINGNSFEVYNAIFNKLNPKRVNELLNVFSGYDWVIKKAKSELIKNTAIIYLPWKCSIDSINNAFNKMGDVRKIVLISHDYLTNISIPNHYKKNIKLCQNEEQIILALDLASQRTTEIEGYYGHIGMHYPSFHKTFMHHVKVKSYHVDEKNQKLLSLKIK